MHSHSVYKLQVYLSSGRESVTGCLSLGGNSNSSPSPNLLRENGKSGSEVNGDSRIGEYSLNESSLDILDLDAIQCKSVCYHSDW